MNDSRLSDPAGPRSTRVQRLILSDFRSYAQLDLRVSASQIALTGDNGAGKTNILEALSLFTPGRGLRRADFSTCAKRDGAGGWAISIEIGDGDGVVQLGTGYSPQGEGAASGRRNRIQRAPAASSGAFADYIRFVWLTPDMDLLFVGAPGDRRRFLDRLVLAMDAEHVARVTALERASRSRNRLLEDGPLRSAWLDAVEREIAELAVAVAAARADAVDRLAGVIRAARSDDAKRAFPWADVSLVGELEELAAQMPALDVEERYRKFLHANRARDAAAKRTAAGLRSADLAVRHGPKSEEAALCSTGEQKALLVGLVLAQARLVADAAGLAPVVLLDEVAAHFDPARREALYQDLASLGSQVWMTGADPAAFADLGPQAELLRVADGRIAQDSSRL